MLKTATNLTVLTHPVEMVVGRVKMVMQLDKMVLDLWRKPFLVFPVMTIPSLLKYQRHPSCVMVKQMEDTMLIKKLSVRHSISVPMMEMED